MRKGTGAGRRRNPSLGGLVRALGAPVRGYRRATEWSTGSKVAIRQSPKDQAREAREIAAARGAGQAAERAERRREQLHELRMARAAAALQVAQERALREVDRRRRDAERAATASERARAKAAARTQEGKADELEELGRKLERGELSSEQIRYFINTYGPGGPKGTKRRGS